MSFIGLATTNPIFASAMLDRNKWRCVVYADTPVCLDLYDKWVKEPKDGRKAVLLLVGASLLNKVEKDYDKFHSIIVFDDVENLTCLSEIFPDFAICDIEDGPIGEVPYTLTPAELVSKLSEAGGFPDTAPLLTRIRSVLGTQKPSVLEATSRMPDPEQLPHSGVQRLLTNIKDLLDKSESDLPFAVVVDYYTRFTFHMVKRSKLTSIVTKKLPSEAKDLWQVALDFATSGIGMRMYSAYRRLCESDDPDYRVSHAVQEYDLKQYSGDFVYLNAILPAHSSAEFIDDDHLSPVPPQRFVPDSGA